MSTLDAAPATPAAHGLRVVHDREPRLAGDVMARFGLDGPDPQWVSKLLNEQSLAWLLERWDQEERILKMQETDNTTAMGERRRPWIRFAGASDQVVIEVLTGVTIDHQAGKKTDIEPTVGVVNAAGSVRTSSIRYLSDVQIGQDPGKRLRVWQEMFDIATADRDTEWARDEVRLAVVKPKAKSKLMLPLGMISQPWLRTMTAGLLRARSHQLGSDALYKQAVAMGVLSQFLATRDDGGNDPRALMSDSMRQFSEYLADADISVHWHREKLDAVSSVLTQARALELSPSRLRGGFTVEPHLYPKTPLAEHVERAIPIATFKLLMGSDQLLGPTSARLLASLRKREFDGMVLVEVDRFMANFGRRLDEACRLTLDRVRFDDNGGTAILYNNFKNRKDRVWLPVDAWEARSLRDYVARLREHFPNTPVDELRLFPKDTLGGTMPIHAATASHTHTIWVRTLEEAIILAKLHTTTNIDLNQLRGLSCADLDGDQLSVHNTIYELDGDTCSMLVDYRQNVLDWDARAARRGRRAPADPSTLPLFPDWKMKAGSRGWRHLPLSRLAALGDDWVSRAAEYTSPGLPGGHLGEDRVHPDEVHIERLRHTYLQHAYNATRDILTVQELAGHRDLNTTVSAYVSTSEHLREAVDMTSRYRRNIHGHLPHYDVPLATRRVPFVPGECGNPQVLDLGVSGCPKDGDCADCDHFISDPSNLPELRQRIASAQAAIATAQSDPDASTRKAKTHVLRLKVTTLRRVVNMHEGLLADLPNDKRERLLMACEVVRDFRESVRQGGAGSTLASLEVDSRIERVTKGVLDDEVS